MELHLCAYPNLHIVHCTISDSSPQYLNKMTLFKAKRQFNSILFRRITRILKNSIKLQHSHSSMQCSVSLRRQCWRTGYFLILSWYQVQVMPPIFLLVIFKCQIRMRHYFYRHFWNYFWRHFWNVEFLLVYWGRIVGGVHLEIC